MGITKKKRSHAIARTPVTAKTRRSSRLPTRSRRLPPGALPACARGSLALDTARAIAGTIADTARIANVARYPAWSMASPAVVGPRKPEIENPRASQLKLTARSSGPLRAPTAFWTAMWNTMNASPITVPATYRAGSPGARAGRPTPHAIATDDHSRGRPVPTRSIMRPAATPSSMGSTE